MKKPETLLIIFSVIVISIVLIINEKPERRHYHKEHGIYDPGRYFDSNPIRIPVIICYTDSTEFLDGNHIETNASRTRLGQW